MLRQENTREKNIKNWPVTAIHAPAMSILREMDLDLAAALADCPLFRGLDKNETAVLLPDNSYQLKQHRAGALIGQRGDHIENLRILLKGQLSAEMLDPKGKVLKIESLKGPCSLAAPLLFASESFLPVQLRGETDCSLIHIPRNQILTMLAQSSRLLANFLTNAGDKITFLSNKIHLFQFATIRQKTAHYLMDLKERSHSDDIRLPVSIETLSEMFSVSRPALSRTLTEMAEEGLFQKEGRRFHLHAAALKRVIEDE